MANITALLTTVLLGILKDSVSFYNTSFGISVLHDSLGLEGISVAGGLDDRFLGTSVSTKSKWPVGSITKTVTTIRALRLYELGLLDIDVPVHTIVDPLIMRDNQTTLMGIFKDARVNQITSRQLMMMRSGMPDYNDEALQQWTYANPNKDRTPYDLLYEAGGKGLLCDPGTCGQYSTTGFNLMGLVIAAAEGKTSWLDLDQSTFLPTNDSFAQEMVYPKLGPCTPYLKNDMVHQYAMTYQRGIMDIKVNFFDMVACSCLNAWTGGNLAAPTYSLARIMHDLMHLKFLNQTTVQEMINFAPLSKKSHMKYGIGLMEFDMTPNVSDKTSLFGHFGMDYGSGGLTLHNNHYDISLSITTNSESGMNCTGDTKSFGHQRFSYFDVLCQVYAAAIKAIFNEDVQPCGNDEAADQILNTMRAQRIPSARLECSWNDNVPK